MIKWDRHCSKQSYNQSYDFECLMSTNIALILIIHWTLNKHFTWHFFILCSCMSFCYLKRMHLKFFFSEDLSFHWVNQRVDISSSSILAFQNFLVTLYLARSFLVTMPTTWNMISIIMFQKLQCYSKVDLLLSNFTHKYKQFLHVNSMFGSKEKFNYVPEILKF